MARSQNGWVASPDKRTIGVQAFSVAGVDFPGGVKAGDVAEVLGYVVQRFHDEVEPLTSGWCWGWAYRDVRGSAGLSNHASGTAVDVNAPRHPIGSVGTFTPSQRVAIRAIVDATGGVVRWGGDYSSRKDEMHFEISADAVAVARLANIIRNSKEADVPLTQTDVNAVLMGKVTGTDPRTGKPETHPFQEWLTVMAYRVRDLTERLEALESERGQ